MAGKGDTGHPRMTANYPGTSSGHSEEQKGLKEKAQEMASNVGESASHLKERAQEFASGVAGQAGDAWRSTREGMQEGFSSVAHRAEDFWGDVNGLIRRYPVAALGAAFGLGCLVSCALLLSSGSDSMTERMSRSSS